MHRSRTSEAIRALYDQQPEREWERLERQRTEFAVTMRALNEHLPPPPARVLDCGGHRREAGDWVPTAATTETTVDLDGVPVCVSWLEEEVLAYIRRGRLDRTAQCLPHCDQDRLLALLRGEQDTGVL